MEANRIIHEDCLEVMREMENNSIDAIVTDPPYGINFMGRKWDDDCPEVEVWRECLRILKPGGHLLAFSGTRTIDLVMGRIRDAGFEIRDCLMWLSGQGFPKSHDVSKAIDKTLGHEREIIGKRKHPTLKDTKKIEEQAKAAHGNNDWSREWDITKPSTPEAQQWDGWGTALKPACEPITMARKPFKGPVAANVLEHGTGAINVDGCRIEGPSGSAHWTRIKETGGGGIYGGGGRTEAEFQLLEDLGNKNPSDKGRWPANVIMDEEAGKLLDGQSGELKSGELTAEHQKKGGFAGTVNCYGTAEKGGTGSYKSSSGGASRFFYCAKTSRKERELGLDKFSKKPLHWSSGSQNPGSFQAEGTDKSAKNFHPTVKPIDLMRWLTRLVTPPNGIVFDPFVGTGSTLIAAGLEGFRWIGVEKEAEYARIAQFRLNHWLHMPIDEEIEVEEKEDKGQLSFL